MADTLVKMLRASAATFPRSEAVICGNRRVCYADLWRDVQSVARFLRSNGLHAGDRVALLMENSTEYVTAYYGILAAGGVVVALNTAARQRDLSNWLLHCGAGWLIADEHQPDFAAIVESALSDLRVVATRPIEGVSRCHTEWSDVVRAVDDQGDTWIDVEPNATAAIIYTSGTTGRPKGVTLTHANLASNVRSILAYLDLRPNDRTLNVLPFYYSYGNSVLHSHLAAGASLVIENSLVYLHAVLNKIASEGVTGFSGVPSTYAMILSRVKLQDYDLRSIRYMTQAGGAMSPSQIQAVLHAVPHVRFFVMYGLTEATARLAYLPPERIHDKLGSVGIAVANVQIDVRDEQGQAVPNGVMGEIYARGPNVMREYWNDPEATRQVLKDGWLKTGDLGYRDADGYLFISGRSSDMIKTGAHRVSPQDIEEVIAELDGVAEVAVVGVPDDIMGQSVKAVIVPRADVALEPMTIKAHCHARLASYKIPRHIEFRNQIPKTASGKVQRYLLVNNSRELQSNG